MSEHTHNTFLVGMLFHLILIRTFLFQDAWLNIMRGKYLNAIQRMKGKLCRDIFSDVYSPVPLDVRENFNRRLFFHVAQWEICCSILREFSLYTQSVMYYLHRGAITFLRRNFWAVDSIWGDPTLYHNMFQASSRALEVTMRHNKSSNPVFLISHNPTTQCHTQQTHKQTNDVDKVARKTGYIVMVHIGSDATT